MNANEVDKLTKLYANAACRDANPKLFDATRGRAALKALEFCRDCPVRALCAEVVLAPYQGERAYFSGVAGGRVWVRGVDRTADERDRAMIDWRKVERAVRGEDVALFPQENYVACVAATAAGLSSKEAGALLGLHPVIVRRYRTSSRISELDYRRANRLGESIRAETDEAA